MIGIEELIKHLEDVYALSIDDLTLNDTKRANLFGKLELIQEIKELNEKGLPHETK